MRRPFGFPGAASHPEAALPDLGSGSFPKPTFTLEQLRTFLAVAARQHVTGAAGALGLSQAAVSQQVHLLERVLGVRLLRPSGRNIRLTEAGTQVAAAALRVMRSAEGLARVARDAERLEGGSTAVGASEVAAGYHLPARLAALAAADPELRVDVLVGRTRDICERIADGALSCGLVDGPVPRTSLLRAEVAVDEVLLVAHPGHPLAGRRTVGPSDLVGHRYLAARSDSALEKAAARVVGPARQRVVRQQLPTLDAVRQTLLSGLGIAALPASAVADDLRDGALIALPLARAPLPIWALRTEPPAGPAGEALWQALLAGPADLARAG